MAHAVSNMHNNFYFINILHNHLNVTQSDELDHIVNLGERMKQFQQELQLQYLSEIEQLYVIQSHKKNYNLKASFFCWQLFAAWIESGQCACFFILTLAEFITNVVIVATIIIGSSILHIVNTIVFTAL